MQKVFVDGVDHSTFSSTDKEEIKKLATRVARLLPGAESVVVTTSKRRGKNGTVYLNYKVTMDLGKVFSLPDRLRFVRTIRFTSSGKWSIIPDRFGVKKMPRVRPDQIKEIDPEKGLLKSWGVQQTLLSWYFADIGYYAFSLGGLSLCRWDIERAIYPRGK